MARIGIFGAGYVGLVTGACFADLGHEVVLRDIDGELVERLHAGETSIYEPGLKELIEKNLDRISFTLKLDAVLAGAEFLFVAVPTPASESGDADLRHVWGVIDDLPADLPGPPVIVMKSTVPVGTGSEARTRLDQRGLTEYAYVSNPEFLVEGNAINDFMEPDRVVVGARTAEDGERVLDLYRGVKTDNFFATDVESAELVKLAANAFLATRVSFINEIANLCELVGADVTEVARGMGLDERIGPLFLKAGVGYGGSCFPKDLKGLEKLAKNEGYAFRTLAAVQEVNRLQNLVAVEKLERRLGALGGKTVALLGLAFKPNTDDMREAPSRVIAARLVAEGADVRGWDPVARPDDMPGVELCDSVLDAVRGADAAVIVTEWPELREVLPSDEVRDAMARPLIIDGRNLLDPAAVVAAGFEYEAIGRPTKATAVPVSP